MARRQKHEEHENLERWLVSYADFITLLFAFFVVMYSISQVKPLREIPRLCRGGSRSLTFAGVHRETSRVSR
ncbi:MAG: hypothetical protein COZ23_07480, partial [Hydrogenophilales bacterium CG_4_10_14_3_um_filter_58_23]